MPGFSYDASGRTRGGAAGRGNRGADEPERPVRLGHPARTRGWIDLVRLGAVELADLAWPSTCVGCGAWGIAWCERCDGSLDHLGVRVRPVFAPLLTVHAAELFEGPLRHAITAFKDDGRLDAAGALAALARRAVGDAVGAALRRSPAPGNPTSFGPEDDSGLDDGLAAAARRGVVLVPIPSSRASYRVRGRRPLDEVAALVRAGSGVTDGRALLRHTGRVRDQSKLSLAERGRNVASAFVVPPRPGAAVVARQPLVVLLDDVVTSGATLAAAHRALTEAGARFVVCAAIAATPRQSERDRRGASVSR